MSRGGPDGWLRCFTHRLAPSAVHRCVQEACTVPCFCSRFFKSGSWDFWSLHVFCPELAPTQLAHVPTQLFLVPHHFFVFYGSRRGVFRCKLCSTAPKGPRLQPVSTELRFKAQAANSKTLLTVNHDVYIIPFMFFKISPENLAHKLFNSNS